MMLEEQRGREAPWALKPTRHSAESGSMAEKPLAAQGGELLRNRAPAEVDLPARLSERALMQPRVRCRSRVRSSTMDWVRYLGAACLLAAVGAAPLVSAQGGKPVLHVFLQLDAKSGALEKMLQQQLPNLTVTVFSRYRDLEDASAAAKPDGLIAITPILEQRGKKPSLQGTRSGKDEEAYLLVSVGAVLDGSLSGKTIGAVDVMGRDGTQSFVAGLVKAKDVKVKRVAKTEDLLPLLEFSAADGILIPSSALARLTERTRLDIKSKEAPGGQVGLPALAVFNDANKEAITKALSAVDGATKKILGIDAWSVR